MATLCARPLGLAALLCSSAVLAAAPTIDSTPPASTLLADAYYEYTITATDPDGDAITYSLATPLPAWLSFDSPTIRGRASNADVGDYSFTVRASDGISSVDQLVNVTVTFNPDLDSDGDGMPDGYELDKGFDPNYRYDALEDADNDGLSNIFEYNAGTDPLVDDQAPVISVPGELTVDPYGLYTKVDTGTATAVDGADGVVAVSSSGQQSHYRPGHHRILWSSSDSEGNLSSRWQDFYVRPFVEFGNDVAVVEGGVGRVKIILNGTPPSYPVTVTYRVTGADGSADHSLASQGSVTINQPALEADIQFDVYDDGLAEPVETLQLSMIDVGGDAVIGANDDVAVHIHEGNLPPRLRLVAQQAGLPVRTVTQDSGLVTVTASLSDPNPDDSHVYNWAGTVNALTDTSAQDEVFSFDPASVSPGVYVLRADACDQLSACGDAELAIRVVASRSPLSATLDADGDGSVDSLEGYSDKDSDGVPDYLDGLDRLNALQLSPGDQPGQYQLESDPGSELRLGMVAVMAARDQAGVSMAEVDAYGNNGLATADADYSYAAGLLDIRLESLAAAGQSARFVVPLGESIPVDALYRNLLVNGWQDFVEDEGNALASAIGEQGFCPPPGDARYGPGLTAGHWCLQVTVADGGANDADALANGRISHLGGLTQRQAAAPSANDNNSGLGGTGPWWWLMLIPVWLRYRSARA